VIPTKLRDDAIVEAVCQVQFAAQDEIPEVVVGRLSDFDLGMFASTRLPISEMPPTMRRNDPNLRLQPLLELRHNKRSLTIRVGENVISVHAVGANAYPGWAGFKADVVMMLSQLFSKVPHAQIESLSLRYINAIVSNRHRINGVQDLELKVSIKGKDFTGPVLVNYSEKSGDAFLITTRVADPSFVQGNLPAATVAIVDVEVVSPKTYRPSSQSEVTDWFETAHSTEKEAFFRLIPQSVLSQLIEE
jgi:uncharacterized protein (TIGR04255 family)